MKLRVRIVDLAAGGRVELQDLGEGGLELFLGHAAAGQDLLEVLAGEFVEVVTKDALGVLRVRGSLEGADLEEEAFLEVAGADAGGVEFLDDLEHAEDLLFVGLDAGAEGEVVDEGVEVAAEVAVFVEAADDEGSDVLFMLGKVAEAELVEEALGKALLDGEGIVFGTFVLAVVIDFEAVSGNRIVRVELVDGAVLRLVVLVVAAFDRVVVVKHRILLKLRADALFQFLDRQFDELDGLDLKRRQLLGLFQFESLLDHIRS